MMMGKEQFGAIPMRAFKDTRLTRTHLCVLGVVSHFDRFGKNGTGCYATQERIGQMAGCTFKTVSSRIQDLVKWGYLDASRQKNRRRMQYRVVHDTPSVEGVLNGNTPSVEGVSGSTLLPQREQRYSGEPALIDSAHKPLLNPQQHFKKDSPEGACTRVPASPHTRKEIVSEEDWWKYKSQVARLIRDGHVFSGNETKQVQDAFDALCDFDYENRELEMAFEGLFLDLEYAEVAAHV